MESTSADTQTGRPFSPLQALAQLNPYVWSTGLFMRGFALIKAADHLADGPRTAAELAEATGTHAPSLARFLRACALHGLVTWVGKDRYELTELGQLVRSDVPSLRSFVIAVNGPGMTRVWEHLVDVLKTGEPASKQALGMDHWEWYEANPEEGRYYAECNGLLTVEAAHVIAASYDLSQVTRIVDVGGSPGALLAGALKAAPQATGVLFDLPAAVRNAEKTFAEQGLTDRLELVSGDFMTSVPEGGDLYLVKNILCDLDDTSAATLLRNCLAAMAPGGRLLLLDWIYTDTPSFVHATDVEFMVLTGGRGRTLDEYRQLLVDAGFAPPERVQLRGFEMAPFIVLEAARP
ncbi:methyltransferase [Asanoa iriomotensis]|uniref:Methyltransferase n=1 Tax=Asanoa iriomotensis TaxID=234613 RepID=A0ABQ4C0W3_9ACTN|nr:methyltransferase [Asanoa iriomotensis]GIF56414.1 methyltransferase [Asanoa iriomotensis]